MLYLEENHIVHRDLALRNVLVTSVHGKYVAKVTWVAIVKINKRCLILACLEQ